jgi:hypothetical protein
VSSTTHPNKRLFTVSRIAFFFLLFFSGCGYRWTPDYPEGARPTLTIPFVTGDEEGLLTSELVSAFAASGLVRVVPQSGAYRLVVTMGSAQNQTIGFRRDPQKIGSKIKKNLLADEGRKTVQVEAIVFRGETEEVVYGPYLLSADAEYDYVDGDSIEDLTFTTLNGETVTVLPFSLGQLEPIESAEEGVSSPLFRKIAQKMVDAISAEW